MSSVVSLNHKTGSDCLFALEKKGLIPELAARVTEDWRVAALVMGAIRWPQRFLNEDDSVEALVFEMKVPPDRTLREIISGKFWSWKKEREFLFEFDQFSGLDLDKDFLEERTQGGTYVLDLNLLADPNIFGLPYEKQYKEAIFGNVGVPNAATAAYLLCELFCREGVAPVWKEKSFRVFRTNTVFYLEPIHVTITIGMPDSNKLKVIFNHAHNISSGESDRPLGLFIYRDRLR